MIFDLETIREAIKNSLCFPEVRKKLGIESQKYQKEYLQLLKFVKLNNISIEHFKWLCRECNIEFENGFKWGSHNFWVHGDPQKIAERKKKSSENGANQKHSDETRASISIKRKAYLKKNANKHNWSLYRKGETKPEQLFEEFLKGQNIEFQKFYCPEESIRRYEMDFVLIDRKIGFEINGNQHYDGYGFLAPYYLNRNHYLQSLGWRLIEIPYKNSFNKDILKSILNMVLSTEDNRDFVPIFDGILDLKPTRNLNKKKDAPKNNNNAYKFSSTNQPKRRRGKGKHNKTKKTYIPTGRSAGGWNKGMIFPEQHKVHHPSKEELEKLLWEKPTTQIAEELGVSDKAVEKWAKAYGISKPPRGYWMKKRAKKI